MIIFCRVIPDEKGHYVFLFQYDTRTGLTHNVNCAQTFSQIFLLSSDEETTSLSCKTILGYIRIRLGVVDVVVRV